MCRQKNKTKQNTLTKRPPWILTEKGANALGSKAEAM